MTFEEIDPTKKYTLSKKVEFYNHRSGTFAHFNEGLVVSVLRKNDGYASKTIIVKFADGDIEVFPHQLSPIT